MLSVAQVFLLFVVVLAMGMDILRYRQSKIRTLVFLSWFILWIGATVVIVFPDSTIVIARFVGIGRGVDLIIYLTMILILYLLFRIYVRLEQVDREITQIVRTIALREEGSGHSKTKTDSA